MHSCDARYAGICWTSGFKPVFPFSSGAMAALLHGRSTDIVLGKKTAWEELEQVLCKSLWLLEIR